MSEAEKRTLLKKLGFAQPHPSQDADVIRQTTHVVVTGRDLRACTTIQALKELIFLKFKNAALSATAVLPEIAEKIQSETSLLTPMTFDYDEEPKC